MSDAKSSVMQVLERLLDVATRLREAMMARDVMKIQDVVSDQDALQDLIYTVPHGSGGLFSSDPEVQQAAERLRRLQQANRLLANAFLSVYRNTFSSGVSGSVDPGLYGRNGTLLGTAPASMLVRQMG
jgi:hypothetical protein